MSAVLGNILRSESGFRVYINATKLTFGDSLNLTAPDSSEPPLFVKLSHIEGAKYDQVPVFKLDSSDFDNRGDRDFPYTQRQELCYKKKLTGHRHYFHLKYFLVNTYFKVGKK